MKEKGLFLVVCLLFTSIVSVYSQSKTVDLDFNITIKDLVKSSSDEIDEMASSSVKIIIEGAMATYSVISANESQSGSTEILVELINGEWINEKSVEMYVVKVLFTGEKWIKYFPEDKKQATEASIARNAHLLLLCQVEGFYENGKIPLIHATDLRIIP